MYQSRGLPNFYVAYKHKWCCSHGLLVLGVCWGNVLCILSIAMLPYAPSQCFVKFALFCPIVEPATHSDSCLCHYFLIPPSVYITITSFCLISSSNVFSCTRFCALPSLGIRQAPIALKRRRRKHNFFLQKSEFPLLVQRGSDISCS